jgi:hypothetical protein
MVDEEDALGAAFEERTTRLVREAVSYFRSDLEQDEESMHIVRHPDTHIVQVGGGNTPPLRRFPPFIPHLSASL